MVPDPRVDYDTELRRYDEVLRRACRVGPGEHVLDIGCGTGLTTRRAAATARSVLGVDISAAAVRRARELAAGLDNLTVEQADAQTHPFPPGRYDLAMSRFGTMFFADPGAAFANIARALRPGGRLVMLVWQAREHNEWSLVIRRALAGPEEPTAVPDAFSLADPATVRRILTAAGFTGVDCADVHEPVHYGPDVAAATEWVRGFAWTGEVLRRLDPAAADRALGRLHDTLAAHLTDDGVWLDARAWLVTASTG